jgi:hypothetical protein
MIMTTTMSINQSVIIVMEQVNVQIHIPVVVGSGKIEMPYL